MKIMRSATMLALVAGLAGASGCSEEQQNRLARVGVTWLEGDYRVTYADGEHVKSWEVRDSKVTSDPDRGYYYFWATTPQGKAYVQTPIARSYLEEIP